MGRDNIDRDANSGRVLWLVSEKKLRHPLPVLLSCVKKGSDGPPHLVVAVSNNVELDANLADFIGGGDESPENIVAMITSKVLCLFV